MMKKNRNIITTILMSIFFVFVSCEDDSKEAYNIHTKSENHAPYVRFFRNNQVIDATKLSTEGISGQLSAPSNNVASWSLTVRRTANGVTSSYADLAEVTTFPSDFSVTGQDIATALGIPVTDIQPGNNIEFLGKSIGYDGSELTYDNLAGDLSGQPEQRQAYKLNAFVACPFNNSDIAGTYSVTYHYFDAFFGPQPPTREVISGPESNEFTIIGGAVPLDGGDDLIINVDSNTGIVTGVTNGNDRHFTTYGPAVYGSVSGFAFSCVGFIDLRINSPGFITNTLTMEKL